MGDGISFVSSRFPPGLSEQNEAIAAAYLLTRESVEKSTAMCAYSRFLISRTQTVIEQSQELLKPTP
jgi:hypothetical protein